PPFWATGAEFWAPLIFKPEDRMRQASMLRVFARLRPGVSIEEAGSEAGAVWTRLQEQFPSNRGSRLRVESLKEPVVGGSRRILLVLMAAVGLLLMIACANVANLLLSRSGQRSHEFAIRTAMGARRGRIASQLLIESLVISLVGGLLGVILGVWGLDAVLAVGQKVLPRSEEIRPDGAVLLFSLAISTLSALLFSLPPILTSFRTNLVQPLREGERQGPHRSRSIFGDALVVVQVGLALVLLVGAGLLTRSFWNLVRVDPGFATENVLTMKVSFAGTPFAAPDRQGEFLKTLQEQVSRIPGVETAALTNHLPIGGDFWQARFRTRDTAAVSEEDLPRAAIRTVSPRFLKAAGIGLVSGRDVNDEDMKGGQPVVLVNGRLAELYFPGQNALGQRITVGRTGTGNWSEIVGVVENYRQWALTDDVRPEIIVPYSPNAISQQSWFTNTTLMIRSRGSVETLAGATQKTIWDISPKLAIAEIRTVDHILSAQRADSGFYLAFLALFAGTALLLSLVGIFGLISYVVSERTREIAVRAALGAGRKEILRLVLGRGLFLALAGIGLGIPIAASLVHLLQPLLYQVPQFEPWIFASAGVLFLLVAALACYLPARRAVRIDPAQVLRG
ncbi:MAG: FtsX-like permease family protein, partial [Acidobacteria bacterium]